MALWYIGGTYLGGKLIEGLGSWFGGKEEKKGIDRATEMQERLGQRQLQIYEDLIAEGRPEREASSLARMEAMKQIQQDVMREPGTSQLYKTGLRRGIEGMAREFAPLGLVSGRGGSTAFRRNVGEFAEGLMGREIEGVRAERRYLAGLGPPSTSPATALGAFRQYGQTQENISNLALARSGIDAGLYRDTIGGFGRDIGDLAKFGLSKYGEKQGWFG